ncbi:MAG: hypothetical protein ACT4PP_09790 [Sporichthyaceae bacterium]
MGHEFLSPQWIAAAQQVRDTYAEALTAVEPAATLPRLRVNLQITDAPAAVAQTGTVYAHACTGGPTLVLEVGALPDPDLTVAVDYLTAYDLLIDQRPNAALGAFLRGKIQLTGDVERLADHSGFDLTALPALLGALGITGSSTLADVDPLAAEIGERIRELTA